MDMRARIHAFISEHMAIDDDNIEFDDSDNIFEKGFVDSMFAMQLVSFVEEELQFEVTNDDLDLSNFCSVHNIVRFMETKKVIAGAENA